MLIRLHGELQTCFTEFKSSLEKLCERLNLKVDYLFLIQVVVGLEVNAFISYCQHTVDLY